MDSDTIQALRALSGKVREMTYILDSWLALKSNKASEGGRRQPEESKTQQNRFILLTKWPHDWPTLGTLRHLASRRHKKGLGKVFIKVGKRLVIDEQAFFEWVRSKSR